VELNDKKSRKDPRNNQYFAGPLNLNRVSKQADTVMGTKLSLEADEFDALDFLASQEGSPISFEQLYKVVWASHYADCNRDTARVIMDSLMKQVRLVGEGFMWIEYKPESGYSFRTLWGRSWQTGDKSSIIQAFSPAPAVKKTPRMSNVSRPEIFQRRLALAMAGMGMTVMAAAMVLTILLNGQAPELFPIEDVQVPLASPGFEEVLPDNDKDNDKDNEDDKDDEEEDEDDDGAFDE